MLQLGLRLGMPVYGDFAIGVPPLPNLLTLSSDEITEDAATGTVIGQFLAFGGVAPYTIVLVSNPTGKVALDGDVLEVGGALTGLSSYAFTADVVDANGNGLSGGPQAFSLDIVEAIDNDSGIGEDDGDVVIPDPDDPEDDGGGFEVPPVQQDTSEGLKIAGKNGGSATFFKDLGPPLADDEYIMRYSADWSGMSKEGRQAAVGFAFKSGNNFHLVALRGDGRPATTMLESKIYGDFRKSNQFTVTDDGAAAHGTKDGPNWLKLNIAADGETYTLSTSSNGVSWTAAYTDALPVPLSAADDALQFGPGGYFTNQDKGVFSITIETFEGLSTVPVNTVAPVVTGDVLVGATLTCSTGTWDDGGEAIDTYAYQWYRDGTPIGGATASTHVVVALDASEDIDCGVIATNGAGPSTEAFSNVKTITGETGAAIDAAVMMWSTPNAAFTGNTDVTTSAYGGGTPKLAGFLLGETGSLKTDFANGKIGFGACDATGQFAVAASTIDAQTTGAGTDRRVGVTDKAAIRLAGTAIGSEAQFNAFITNGVRLNVTDDWPGIQKVGDMLLGGSDVQVAVGNVAPATGGGTTVTLGWQPDLVILTSVLDGLADTVTNVFAFAMGWAAWDHAGVLTQEFAVCGADTGTTRLYRTGLETTAAHAQITGTASTYDYTLGISRGATGFTVVASATPSGDKVGYIALKFANGGRCKAGQWALPTGTGAASKDGIGFKPKLVLLVGTQRTTTGLASGTLMAIAALGREPRAVSLATSWVSDGAAQGGSFPSDTRHAIDDQGIYGLLDAGGADFDMELTSMDVDGWTVNVVDAPAAAYLWNYLAIG